ncbi:MAG: Ku protein [Terracidiphilus sp.]
MAGRPNWSGQLKISLVSFGIQLFPAANPQAGISFHEIDRATGQRIRHLNVIGDGEPVENSQIVKGYEYSKGKYLAVDPEEVAKLRIETKNVIDVKQFIALDELAPALFETPYFVVPEPKESPEAFAVVRKAMEQTGKAALGEIAFGGRGHSRFRDQSAQPKFCTNGRRCGRPRAQSRNGGSSETGNRAGAPA